VSGDEPELLVEVRGSLGLLTLNRPRALNALTHGNVRVSLGRDTTEEQVERFVAVLPDLVARLRIEVGL